MSEENENNTESNEENPSTSDGAENGDDSQVDAQQADTPEGIVADGEEMTPEEAETLAAAMAAINQVQGVADSAIESGDSGAGSQGQAFESPVFSDQAASVPKQGMELLSDVHMNVRIELGRTKMFVEDVLKLSDGAVVELDKLAGDPVDVFVNDRKVARGEVLVLNDLFCVRISEIVDISLAEN
ncbi:MAG: flagellar motor switch protein FliN [Phycisphaerales bacterium]|jgi:flagellar motor switch protein FliN/FliY|nr:flagellar motor switch protein FliN [Phycisphaerales bacterium]